MGIKVKNSRKKVRINITVDKSNLKRAKHKLGMFGGKVSSMFNAYLNDFVKSSSKGASDEHDDLVERVKELEGRIKELEGKKR